jgi:hypothetical protein
MAADRKDIGTPPCVYAQMGIQALFRVPEDAYFCIQGAAEREL